MHGGQGRGLGRNGVVHSEGEETAAAEEGATAGSGASADGRVPRLCAAERVGAATQRDMVLAWSEASDSVCGSTCSMAERGRGQDSNLFSH